MLQVKYLHRGDSHPFGIFPLLQIQIICNIFQVTFDIENSTWKSAENPNTIKLTQFIPVSSTCNSPSLKHRETTLLRALRNFSHFSSLL